MKERPVLYLETSVFGFHFDEEPRNALRREAVVALFDQISLGTFEAFTSPITFIELDRTRGPRHTELLALLREVENVVQDREELDALSEAYLTAGVIPAAYAEDALHVASATIGRADVLVSLNLRHLANEWAERRVNSVNLQRGYQQIRIRTPEEVLRYED
jgi:hypothetical protein